jgi:3-methyl-2-oxobutanoate hydroxymethyltransferase
VSTTRTSAATQARPTRSGERTTVATLAEKKARGEPITMLTAYDYPTARALDDAGVDAILVGDTLAMVVLGHPTTLAVTMDEMLHHARAVSRGASRALLIGDLPFMSYQADPALAVRNAGRFLQEAGMHAVKLEGAHPETARAIARAGIPVQGHLGLTPQSVHALGGFRVQGRTAAAARALLRDALALQEAGCFSIVLEGVPERLAELLTRRLAVPTIGIGAGSSTDGQVLVTHDLVGLYEGASPRFVKRYAELGRALRDAASAYRRDVEARAFPGPEHAYAMPEAEWQAFLAELAAPAPPAFPSR